MKKLGALAFARILPVVLLGLGLPVLADMQTTGRKNPDVVITSVAGQDLFEFYCASCHGRDGKGNGRVAPALKVPPPDLTRLAQQNRGTFPAARVERVTQGRRGPVDPRARRERHAGVGTDLQGPRQPRRGEPAANRKPHQVHRIDSGQGESHLSSLRFASGAVAGLQSWSMRLSSCGGATCTPIL